MDLARPGVPVSSVLAGYNGAGKSSLLGRLMREVGSDYFNPDEEARRIRDKTGCTENEANSLAWNEGKRNLELAIGDRFNYSFESTLGGHTIASLLIDAANA